MGCRLLICILPELRQEELVAFKATHAYLAIDRVLYQTDEWCIQHLIQAVTISCGDDYLAPEPSEVPKLPKHENENPWTGRYYESYREQAFDDVVDHLQEIEHDHIRDLDILGESIDDSA